jgi:hypothetical protein
MPSSLQSFSDFLGSSQRSSRDCSTSSNRRGSQSRRCCRRSVRSAT